LAVEELQRSWPSVILRGPVTRFPPLHICPSQVCKPWRTARIGTKSSIQIFNPKQKVETVDVATRQAQDMDTLSQLMVHEYCGNTRGEPRDDLEYHKRVLLYVARLDPMQLADFLKLADVHHVLVRTLTVLQAAAVAIDDGPMTNWCGERLADERAHIEHSVGRLHTICEALESRGCHVAVIKSLDHWPDLGSDLDLYTTASQPCVEQVMRKQLGAHPVDRSWGDRLANKWNYRVPELWELVEIHVQFLGQTGEHSEMARRVVDRRIQKEVGGYDFHVPAPEERIVISTLQRVYRHFYFRLCDMIDFAVLLRRGPIHFSELQKSADLAGVWPGVATFLSLIQGYIASYEGAVPLPEEVLDSAHSRGAGVHFAAGFLRVSKLTAAGLYGLQLLHAGQQGDLRAIVRLPLLPPLAVSAVVAHGLTGNDKGIW
jgi:hypothetical protein